MFRIKIKQSLQWITWLPQVIVIFLFLEVIAQIW
jgi:hypothetical protein